MSRPAMPSARDREPRHGVPARERHRVLHTDLGARRDAHRDPKKLWFATSAGPSEEAGTALFSRALARPRRAPRRGVNGAPDGLGSPRSHETLPFGDFTYSVVEPGPASSPEGRQRTRLRDASLGRRGWSSAASGAHRRGGDFTYSVVEFLMTRPGERALVWQPRDAGARGCATRSGARPCARDVRGHVLVECRIRDRSRGYPRRHSFCSAPRCGPLRARCRFRCSERDPLTDAAEPRLRASMRCSSGRAPAATPACGSLPVPPGSPSSEGQS